MEAIFEIPNFLIPDTNKKVYDSETQVFICCHENAPI